MTRSSIFRPVDLLAMVTGLGLAAVSAVALLTPGPARAAQGADGSDWGPQGSLTSDSSVTLRWDNQGNPATDTVERNSLQQLPHTLDKTYASIPSAVRTAYKDTFGADNGEGGLEITVSQTRDLVNQAVVVSAKGAAGGTRDLNGAYLQIMQCWGSAEADQPDPAHCQFGGFGPGASSAVRADRRSVLGDSLVDGGDWAEYKTNGWVPFTAVDGTVADGDPNRNSLFNSTTTNEWPHAAFDEHGEVTRTVELQTGSESSGLGCGARADAPSTDTCWLVVVPRLANQQPALGAISPQLWGQRLQAQLKFRDVFASCPGDRARLLLGGSEALRGAATSWAPGACAAQQVTLGYTQLGDPAARTQYTSGANPAVLTTRPVTGAREGTQTAYTPLALTAAVVGYSIDYRPGCSLGSQLDLARVAAETGAQGEQDARDCGYDSLADARADYAKSGTPITDLRLNARLVAKLLTQSYSTLFGTAPCCPGLDVAPVATDLFADPEFQALNPQLKHGFSDAAHALGPGRAFVEAMRTDEAATLWSWVLSDPGGASFLAGCPDPYGQTVNPFFSTRTYEGCQAYAKGLERQAAATRAANVKPATYVDQALTYPPAGSPYPFPGYYEVAQKGEAENVEYGTLTLTDMFPAYNDAAAVARQAAYFGTPVWNYCKTSSDLTCLPSPGRWKTSAERAETGTRKVMGVTDAGSAALYQLPTAKLCDEQGEHCVGASTSTLEGAAGHFVDDAASGTLQPSTDAGSLYVDGAYPLALPVYAAVNLTTTSADDRASYARLFEYLTGSGQIPGFTAGSLPPGYAPLTAQLQQLAARGIAALRTGPTQSPSPTPSDTPSTSATPIDDPSPSSTDSATPTTATSTTPADVSGPPGPGGSPPATPGASQTTQGAATPGALAPAAAGTETWPRYLLPLGLGIALLSGLAGPMLRARTRLRLR